LFAVIHEKEKTTPCATPMGSWGCTFQILLGQFRVCRPHEGKDLRFLSGPTVKNYS